MRKNKLFFMVMGLLVMGASMVGCFQSDIGEEKQNVTEISADNSKMETVEENGNTETSSQKSTFSVEEITYKITGADTVAVKKLKNKYSETVLEIPEEVTYNQKMYTVTSIEMKNLGQNYPSVEKIIVPKTVTEKMVISRRYLSEYVKMQDDDSDVVKTEELCGGVKFGKVVEDTDPIEAIMGKRESRECKIEYIQAFPNLTTIKFLSDMPPKQIQIEQYVTQNNLCYEVPKGTRESYKKVADKITLHLIKGYNEYWVYKSISLMPDIIEEGENNPEYGIFTTDTGVYLVKESAKNGKGKVALLHLDNVKIANAEIGIEGTLESEVRNGIYRYELTELETGSIQLETLRKDSVVILTLPDTITKLKEACLDLRIPYLYLPKNCTPKGDIFQLRYDSYEPGMSHFCYAAGVRNFYSWCYSVIISPEEMKKELGDVINATFVEKVDKGAEIEELETIIVREGEKSKQINATFIGDTNETLGYMMVVTDEMYENGWCGSYGREELKKKIDVSADGTITAKKAGTYYCMVYSQESGNHKIVKIIVEK